MLPKWRGNCAEDLQQGPSIAIDCWNHEDTYRKSKSMPILLSISLNFHLAPISSQNVARPFFDDKLQCVEDLLRTTSGQAKHQADFHPGRNTGWPHTLHQRASKATVKHANDPALAFKKAQAARHRPTKSTDQWSKDFQLVVVFLTNRRHFFPWKTSMVLDWGLGGWQQNPKVQTTLPQSRVRK